MFNDKQNQVLAYEIDSTRIKTREKGNMSLSYLEGFDIIDTANKIFGFGNWSYSISTLELVSQETNQNQNSVICYKAIVNVVIHDLQHSKHISREDVGFGTGIAKSLADAHESSGKEAVTDALKRALRSIGNQFGNSLYDKSRAHQNQQSSQPQQQTQQPSIPQRSNNIPQDYASLYNLGLSVVQQGNSLVVIGEDIFAKKDSIKSFGFKWDTKNRVWHKLLEQQAA